MEPHDVIFAVDTSVHRNRPYTLSAETRTGHVLVTGTAPRSKHALLWNLMLQDIEAGAGVAVLDPTGEFAANLLDNIPPARAHQTYFFKPHDPKYAVGFNPFRGVPKEKRAVAAQETMELFKAVWDLSYERTPLLLDILRATARVLLDWPDASFLSMYQLLINEPFRLQVTANCSDPIARSFWREFEAWTAADKRDKPGPVMTRLRAFLSDAHLRNSLGQVGGALDLERVVGERQVFLADLSERELGSETSMLFGSLLASRFRIVLSSLSGTKPFYLYIPDCQKFHAGLCARLFANPISAAGAILSTDQVGAETPEVRGALLRADTLLAFRLGPDDVRHMQARFSVSSAEDSLQSLSPERLASSRHQYELAAVPKYEQRWRQRRQIVERSRRVLAVRTSTIERKIDRFLDGAGEAW